MEIALKYFSPLNLFNMGTKVLETNPPGLIKYWAKSPNSKFNRDLNLEAKEWGIKVIFYAKRLDFFTVTIIQFKVVFSRL